VTDYIYTNDYFVSDIGLGPLLFVLLAYERLGDVHPRRLLLNY